MHAYLPSYECCTIYWLKEIVQGTKKFIHCDKVRYLSVPQYEGLGIKEILAEAKRHEVVLQHLPHEDDLKRLPRQWIINCAYTLLNKPFADWVQERTEARNQKLIDEHEMGINIDPQIMRCFEASTHVSSKSKLGSIPETNF